MVFSLVDVRSTWRTLAAALDRRTARDIALVCVADVLVGASFGAISVSGGLSWWVLVLLSVLVFPISGLSMLKRAMRDEGTPVPEPTAAEPSPQMAM